MWEQPRLLGCGDGEFRVNQGADATFNVVELGGGDGTVRAEGHIDNLCDVSRDSVGCATLHDDDPVRQVHGFLDGVGRGRPMRGMSPSFLVLSVGGGLMGGGAGRA